ncbi:MAG: RagB/SusD family nutrient uptake outer membrane protein [Chitinophagales bacterium]|nr:RagB/SusD family nutrient uptake outer membrane protein [Chitinophagales bacterium]
MKKILLIAAPVLILMVAGCKKSYLETVPTDAASEAQIFSKINAVNAALGGLYKEMFTFAVGGGGHSDYGQKTYDLSADLMGNDMVVHSQGYGWYNTTYQYTNWGLATTGQISDFGWFRYYDMIKQANKLYNFVDGVIDASATQKESIKGQALGMRAYCYFNLINYYQQTYKGHETAPGVPIYTQDTTGGKSRGTVQDVYNRIIADLTEAETLLTGKTRASKNEIDVKVVQGIRARVALVMEDWATAATYANKARQGYSPMTSAQYTAFSAFSSVNNAEWMWGSVITASEATIYASFWSHMDIRTGGYAALGQQKKITKALYDQIPAGDIRKAVFVAPGTGTSSNPDYNQIKHQVPDVSNRWQADYLYMRAAEMYLIEAEALARQGGQDAAARTVLEALVQTRYPAYSAAGFSGTSLVDEILLQRRIELWGEGFSLFDIKRLNQGLNRPTGAGNHGAPNFNPVVYTTGPHDPRFLMRIPQRELDNNASMTPADQNP